MLPTPSPDGPPGPPPDEFTAGPIPRLELRGAHTCTFDSNHASPDAQCHREPLTPMLACILYALQNGCGRDPQLTPFGWLMMRKKQTGRGNELPS